MSELFPELDDAPSEAKLGAATRRLFAWLSDAAVDDEPSVRNSGPGIAARVEVRERFARALGLPGRVRELKRVDERLIELVVELDGRLLRGSIVPLGEPAWRTGERFGVSYRGVFHPQLARALLRFLARYRAVPFERILALIEPEHDDVHMLATDYPESVLYSYAPSGGWRRFFEGTELYRGTCSSYAGKVAVVDHTDIECVFSQVTFENVAPAFFCTPTLSRPKADAAQPRVTELLTDIRDRDVIAGADRLLDEALDSLVEHPDAPELVIVKAGCLPEVTGDDLHAAVARTAGRLRLPVVVVGQHNDPVGASLAQLVAAAAKDPQRPLDGDCVALLGLPDFRGRDELRALLEQVGLSVGMVLPEASPDQLERLSHASLFVIHPWERHEPRARELAAAYAPARALQLAAPAGPSGCRRWLLGIAEALGRREAMQALVDARWSALEPRWRAASARACRHRLGFVVDHAGWMRTLAARRSFGISLLEVLREMGFEIEVLAFAGTTEVPEQQLDGVRVRGYRERDELAEMLRSGGVSAWYSELFYERRLTRSGTNAFSLRPFQWGLEGAVETLEALLQSVELPFYRRYGHLLGPAFPGEVPR